jgi:hypothetical protein
MTAPRIASGHPRALRRGWRAAGALAAGCWLAGAAIAQSDAAQRPQRAAAASSAPATAATRDVRTAPRRASPYPQQRVTDKAKKYYAGEWGIDKMKVSYTSSGNLIRFSYRVSDAQLAKPLASKEDTPMLVGVRSRAVLQIPVMDKVGALRQATAPEVGHEYWMMFSNKGNLVRPGDRVNVIIGQFHADGLVVE